MDFLKSAVASAISKGPPFPYSFGDRVDVDNSIWALHNGTKREDGSNCSIFAFDVNANRGRLPLAKNALRKLRTLRHPGVVRVLDTVETDSYIYIATERIVPLSWHVKRKALNEETIKWGLCNTANTLKFINEEANSVHGNVRISSIFTTESGEWKLAGFEVMSSLRDDDPAIYTYGSLLPDSGRYAPPEVAKAGWGALKEQSISAADAYLFGILIYDAFNGGVFMSSNQLASPHSIPQQFVQSYRRLLQQNPKSRLSIAHFLAQGKRQGGYFDTPLIRVAEFVENMGMKGESEREEFLALLEETGDQFPEDFYKMKVLPELLKVVEFGGGGPKVFSVVLKIGESLTSEEWESMIVPVVVRLFAVPDRAIRVLLLDSLPKIIDHLPQRIVNDKIFPEMMTGFTDLAPVVREQSVKAVLVIINKLSDRNINGELLKYLAKTQSDEQPGIRTNTTICLGKIAKHLGQHTRAKVLIAAFSRSLRDPFVHARNASLMALSATADCFDENECAMKILPAICMALVDKEKIIRVQAQKTLDLFIQRVKTLTANMPETALPLVADGAAGAAAAVGAAAVPRIGTPQTDESWAGWAISSFTKKLSTAVGELESTAKQGLGTTVSNGASFPTAGTAGPGQSSDFLGASSSTQSLPGSFPASRTFTHTAQQRATSSGKPSKTFLTNNDDNEETDPDAWADMEEENFFDAPAERASAYAPPTEKLPAKKPFQVHDDEIDFESLVRPKKNPLPRGLVKTSGTVTGSTRRGAGGIGGSPAVAAAKKAATVGGPMRKATTASGPAKKAGTASAAAKKASSSVDKKDSSWGIDDWGDDNW